MAQKRMQLAVGMAEWSEAYANASEEQTGHRVLGTAVSRAWIQAVGGAYLISDDGKKLAVFVGGSGGSHDWG